MFLAHFGVGFGAKRLAPATSLGSLFLAAQFIDLLWPSLLMLGIEQVTIVHDSGQHPPLDFTHYPYSHSLLAVLAWVGQAQWLLVAWAYWIDRHRRAHIVGTANPSYAV